MLVGRKSLRHEGHKVTSSNKSIQGQWEPNMWNTFPRHGILEFMQMKEHRVKWETYGAERPDIKRKPKNTYTRYGRSKNSTFNNL